MKDKNIFMLLLLISVVYILYQSESIKKEKEIKRPQEKKIENC